MRVSSFLTVASCAVACAFAGASARAEDKATAGYPDFTFHRIAAPPAGQGPRISVQIDPEAQAAYIAARPKPSGVRPESEAPEATSAALPGMPEPSGWEWFWTGVSPKIDEAGPANVTRALAVLGSTEGVPEPRLQALQNIAAAHGREILTATVGTRVSPALVLALISVESSGKAGAESHKGAQGLMQLIPATAERFGVTDSTDPAQNIKGGVAYLEWLLEKFGHDPILALAGYNAGENAVTQYGGVPPYAETRAYVPKVLAAWRVARGLCLTPPELVTDACVFAVQG